MARHEARGCTPGDPARHPIDSAANAIELPARQCRQTSIGAVAAAARFHTAPDLHTPRLLQNDPLPERFGPFPRVRIGLAGRPDRLRRSWLRLRPPRLAVDRTRSPFANEHG